MRLRHHCLLVCIAALLTACHGGGGDDTPPPNDPPPPTTPVGGLYARPSNTMCFAPAKTANNAGSTISLQRVFAGESFDQPLARLQAPGDSPPWLLLQKT